jgi:hypothetical protein
MALTAAAAEVCDWAPDRSNAATDSVHLRSIADIPSLNEDFLEIRRYSPTSQNRNIAIDRRAQI